MLDSIFGGELSVAVKFVIAFGIVLSLIVLTFVGLRRLAGRRLPLSNSGRARQPRLGVLDAFAIDARRRLVLIRRDNVEHLIMIGGPNDVLVESEIVRAPAQAQLAPQRAQRAPGENTRAAVAPPERNVARALPPPEQAPTPIPPQQREPEPQPITPAAFRNAFPPRPAARPAPPLAENLPPPPPRAPARPQRMESEPTEREAAAPPAKPKAEIDPLYADIERKLGEALSRPAAAPPTPPAPTRSAPPPPPPARSSAPPPPPARPAAPPPPAPRRAPEPPAPKAGKNHLDALEEEMASLLGRDRAT